MFAVGETLVSDDILTEFFCCDLQKCKGCCCVEGNAGAPLEEKEISIIEDNFEKIKPYMLPEGIAVVDKYGVFEMAVDNSMVTTCVDGRECVFFYYDEDGISKCAIEKAFEQKKINFRKPVSCYLYPIRRTHLVVGEALNYDRWSICNDAVECGKAKNLKVYQFLEPVLIEIYGKEWYKTISLLRV